MKQKFELIYITISHSIVFTLVDLCDNFPFTIFQDSPYVYDGPYSYDGAGITKDMHKQAANMMIPRPVFSEKMYTSDAMVMEKEKLNEMSKANSQKKKGGSLDALANPRTKL